MSSVAVRKGDILDFQAARGNNAGQADKGGRRSVEGGGRVEATLLIIDDDHNNLAILDNFFRETAGARMLLSTTGRTAGT